MFQRRPPPAFIEFKGMKFLITDRPSNRSINYFIWELKKYNVNTLVRVCEPTYNASDLMNAGIMVCDLEFQEGLYPPHDTLKEWFRILKQRSHQNPDSCVAVHCIAGLGRAPVMVALALLELGLKYESAVEMIRAQRHGALNARQLAFLEHYKPKSRLKVSIKTNHPCCLQ